MLDKSYLLAGLNALSRASESNYFTDGHRGAALISTYFLCQDLTLPDDAVADIRTAIEAEWMSTPLFAHFPEETPDFSLTERLLPVMEAHLPGLRQAGHNVIFPALALKAFRTHPSAVTPSRVMGICRLIEAFTKVDAPCPDALPTVPLPDNPTDFANFIYAELLSTMTAFDGRGQGWSGHLLTYSYALLELNEMGYTDLAQQGMPGLTQYVCRVRRGPLDTDIPRAEHAPSTLRPHEAAYWTERMQRPLTLGHVFKYPYAYYGLGKRVSDDALRSRSMEDAYRIF